MDIIAVVREKALQVGIDGLILEHGDKFFTELVKASIPNAIKLLPEDRFYNLLLELGFASHYFKESAAYLHAVEETLLSDQSASTPMGDGGPSPRDDLFEQAAGNTNLQRDMESSIVWTSAQRRLGQSLSINFEQKAPVIAQSTREIVRADYWKFGVEFKPEMFRGTPLESHYRALTSLGIEGKFVRYGKPEIVFAQHYLLS